MIRHVLIQQEYEEALKRAFNTIRVTVGSTLGPKGKQVLIDTPYGAPTITKDGVTVASQLNPENPAERLITQTIVQTASKTASIAGDGTTTATILTLALTEAISNLVKKGYRHTDVVAEFKKLLSNTIDFLKSNAKHTSFDKVKAIAAMSSSNNPEIIKLITEAYKDLDEFAVVMVEESRSNQSYIEKLKGYTIDRGWANSNFITNVSDMTARYENVKVLITDQPIKTAHQILPALELCAQSRQPLLIIADDIEPAPLSFAIVNKLRNELPILIVRAPSYGEHRYELLKDLAAYTNATLISMNSSLRLEDIKEEHLGTASKVISDKSKTTIISTASNTEKVKERVKLIEAILAEHSEDSFFYQQAKARKAKLISEVAIIKVGAATESYVKEIKSKLDDALRAVNAAIANGYIPSIASALITLSSALSHEDELILEQFKTALEAPLKLLLHNADIDPLSIIPKLRSKPFNVCYDAISNSFTDYEMSELLDPLEVAKTALESAFQSASLLSNVSSVIFIDPKEKRYSPPSLDESPA